MVWYALPVRSARSKKAPIGVVCTVEVEDNSNLGRYRLLRLGTIPVPPVYVPTAARLAGILGDDCACDIAYVREILLLQQRSCVVNQCNVHVIAEIYRQSVGNTVTAASVQTP